jgi:DNA-binding MarR family transcriptional regulator
MTTPRPRPSHASSPGKRAPVLAGLDEDIGFALRLAQLAVFRDISEAMRELDLKPSEFSALLVIEANPGLKQQTIGELLMIRKPNLVSMIELLVGRGFVDRSSPPGDRRSYSLHLTPRGSEHLTAAKAAHQAHGKRVRAALPNVDYDQLILSLRSLARLPAADD